MEGHLKNLDFSTGLPTKDETKKTTHDNLNVRFQFQSLNGLVIKEDCFQIQEGMDVRKITQ